MGVEGGAGVVGWGVFEGAVEEGEAVDGAVGVAGWGVLGHGVGRVGGGRRTVWFFG